MEDTHAAVEYVILSGCTDTEKELERLVEIFRHSLKTQFGCKHVTVAIEERLNEHCVNPNDGNGYS